MEYREEHDSMGMVRVPAERYWGAQTQRCLNNFKIGSETMPPEMIHAFGVLKKSAARANHALKPGVMTSEKLHAIEQAADEVIDGTLKEHFPLPVWQTGSGTQSNMNVNEVIAVRATQLFYAVNGENHSGENAVTPSVGENAGVLSVCENAGVRPDERVKLHPNDDVNMSQSSNDTFPAALHIAAVLALENHLLPAVGELVNTFRELEERFQGIVKSGRTHLQDAVPVAFSQEISGWRSSLECDMEFIRNTIPPLRQLAIGGTAVGTGLNAPEGFDTLVAAEISALTGISFETAQNKFHALSSRDELVFAHGALKALAADMMKIANDIRWLASGPRCGLGEIHIPENEPGSSIMPGKVNPTQCEQVTMVAVQVMGNDAAIGFAASQGNFELNVFAPLIAYNFLQSARLLGDSIRSFREHCVTGLVPDERKMRENLHNSLMLATALNPYIGYERAAKTVQCAHKEGISLREACVKLGYLTPERFDEIFHPEEMAYPHTPS